MSLIDFKASKTYYSSSIPQSWDSLPSLCIDQKLFTEQIDWFTIQSANIYLPLLMYELLILKISQHFMTVKEFNLGKEKMKILLTVKSRLSQY